MLQFRVQEFVVSTWLIITHRQVALLVGGNLYIHYGGESYLLLYVHCMYVARLASSNTPPSYGVSQVPITAIITRLATPLGCHCGCGRDFVSSVLLHSRLLLFISSSSVFYLSMLDAGVHLRAKLFLIPRKHRLIYLSFTRISQIIEAWRS